MPLPVVDRHRRLQAGRLDRPHRVGHGSRGQQPVADDPPGADVTNRPSADHHRQAVETQLGEQRPGGAPAPRGDHDHGDLAAAALVEGAPDTLRDSPVVPNDGPVEIDGDEADRHSGAS